MGLPFAATVIVWFLFASLLSPGLTRAGLGSLDRWLGVIFGVARGYCCPSCIYCCGNCLGGKWQQPFKMLKARHFQLKRPAFRPLYAR